MADDDKSLFSNVVQIIERFVNNAGLWLWFSIFFAATFALDHYGEIKLNELGTDKRGLVIVLLALSACMLLNAISFHYYLWLALDNTSRAVTRIVFAVVDMVIASPIRDRLKVERTEEYLKKGREHFVEYLGIDCFERIWLIWFIFEWQPKGEWAYQIKRERYSSMPDDIRLWSDSCAFSMWGQYILMEKSDDYAIRLWDNSSFLNAKNSGDQYYYLVEAFPLLDTLKAILGANAELRIHILDIRKRVTGLSIDQIKSIKKPFRYDIEQQRARAELEEARRRI